MDKEDTGNKNENMVHLRLAHLSMVYLCLNLVSIVYLWFVSRRMAAETCNDCHSMQQYVLLTVVSRLLPNVTSQCAGKAQKIQRIIICAQ